VTAMLRQWVESIGHDLRFGLRQIRRTPGVTAVVVIAAAVGIGGNSTVFSFFNAIHFRTGAVAAPDRLVALHRIDQRDTGGRENLTAAEYEYVRDHAMAFTDVAVQNWTWIWLSQDEQSVEWKGGQVSFNYFDVLGITPHVGGFSSDDRNLSSVVLSYTAWAPHVQWRSPGRRSNGQTQSATLHDCRRRTEGF
jgi:hypothetical protein